MLSLLLTDRFTLAYSISGMKSIVHYIWQLLTLKCKLKRKISSTRVWRLAIPFILCSSLDLLFNNVVVFLYNRCNWTKLFYWFLFFFCFCLFLFLLCFLLLLFCFCLFLFFLITQSQAANCKLPTRNEIYNCTFKNTNEVSIIINIYLRLFFYYYYFN